MVKLHEPEASTLTSTPHLLCLHIKKKRLFPKTILVMHNIETLNTIYIEAKIQRQLSNLRSTTLEGSMVTITPPMRSNKYIIDQLSLCFDVSNSNIKGNSTI
jgi:hypothetical protein